MTVISSPKCYIANPRICNSYAVAIKNYNRKVGKISKTLPIKYPTYSNLYLQNVIRENLRIYNSHVVRKCYYR